MLCRGGALGVPGHRALRWAVPRSGGARPSAGTRAWRSGECAVSAAPRLSARRMGARRAAVALPGREARPASHPRGGRPLLRCRGRRGHGRDHARRGRGVPRPGDGRHPRQDGAGALEPGRASGVRCGPLRLLRRLRRHRLRDRCQQSRAAAHGLTMESGRIASALRVAFGPAFQPNMRGAFVVRAGCFAVLLANAQHAGKSADSWVSLSQFAQLSRTRCHLQEANSFLSRKC